MNLVLTSGSSDTQVIASTTTYIYPTQPVAENTAFALPKQLPAGGTLSTCVTLADTWGNVYVYQAELVQFEDVQIEVQVEYWDVYGSEALRYSRGHLPAYSSSTSDT